MAKRLTILFFLFALLGGNASAGMPFGSRQSGMESMPCCKKNRKMKHGEQPPAEADAARLCCAVNCTSPAPTAPQSATRSSVSPVLSAVAVYSAILDSLLVWQKSRPKQAVSFAAPSPVPRKFQPKYIQHHSFLI